LSELLAGWIGGQALAPGLIASLAISAGMQQKRKLKPRGRPFVRGVSGNPRGRPKEHEDVKAAARQYTVESIERLAFWMRSDDPRASVVAADKLLDRGWGKPSQDVKLQAELGPGLAEIVRQARERVIAVEAKTVIEHEQPLAIEHDGASEPVAYRKEEEQRSGQ
jgi:hypothetical protein